MIFLPFFEIGNNLVNAGVIVLKKSMKKLLDWIGKRVSLTTGLTTYVWQMTAIGF